MKKILCILPVIFFTLVLQAQHTQAEMDKVMVQLQDQIKKNANDTARLKVLKDMLEKQKQLMDVVKNLPANNKIVTNASLYADPGDYGNVDNWKFPAKNIALLSSLPKRVFTKAELVLTCNYPNMHRSSSCCTGNGKTMNRHRILKSSSKKISR